MYIPQNVQCDTRSKTLDPSHLSMFGLPQAQIEQKLSQVAHVMLVQSFPDMSLGQPPNAGSTRGLVPGKRVHQEPPEKQ